MRKIWFRFTVCFTIGLFVFTVYFLMLFPIILQLAQPESTIVIEQTFNAKEDLGPLLLAFTVCFLSGGLFFSLLFVKPIYQILLSINRLSRGESLDRNRLYNRKNKLKVPYLLYKEVIDNLQALEQSLNQAERRRIEIEAAKNDWLAGVSHDLKTPLSYISGYSSLLLGPGYSFSPDELKHHLGQIYQKSIYIKSLIDDLNHLFLIERSGHIPLCLEKIELVDCLQGILNDVAESPQAVTHDFSLIVKEKKIYAECDLKLIRRAFYNLLYNCVEHNPDETRITVTLNKNDQGIMIDIEDDGVGLDEAELAFFEEKPPNSHKSPDRRKGLGLQITRTILEAHGAALTVKNMPQSGSRFSIIWVSRSNAA